MSTLRRDLARLDREAARLAQRNPAARSTGAPPFADRWGRLPKVTRRHVLWIHVPWPAVKKIAAGPDDAHGTGWQRKGLEIVLAVPGMRQLLARRGGFLRKNRDGTWDFSAHCYPVREAADGGGDKPAEIETARIPGARGVDCLWWCRGKPHYVAWDGLRREQSAVADIAYAILLAAQGHSDVRLIDNFQAWHDASGNRTLTAGILSEAEEQRRAERTARPTCAEPGCGIRVDPAVGYCAGHERLQEAGE